MSYIYIDDNQARRLFLNRYLEAKQFAQGNKPLADYTSLELSKSSSVITLSNQQVIFLSQLSSAVVKSENDLTIFNRNYDIPLGFLELGKSTLAEKFKFENESADTLLDYIFISLRNALLNTFISAITGRDTDLKSWFSLMNNISKLPVFLEKIIPPIIEIKDFPQVELTTKLAKNTKLELQFIYFGRSLGEIYFADNKGKTDEEHRSWLMNLNPEKGITVSSIPERFKSDAAAIIGYIVALKYTMINKKASLNEIREFVQDILGLLDSDLSVDEILFYTMFWLGLLKFDLNRFFHTTTSSEILIAIEKKAYQLSKSPESPVFEIFPEKSIMDWLVVKGEKLKASSKRFTEYCKMYSGETPKERTEKQIIQKIEPYNLLTKKVLIFFFKDEYLLERLWNMLSQLRFIEDVLLVYKQYISPDEKDFNLENDLTISSIKKQFAKNYPKIRFEIVSKNILDIDDRDIVNNLKGYMKKHCNETNFVYLTDAKNDKESYRENLWLGTAFSTTPIFNNEENYLFVS
ncbi:MAG: hypothetical protein BGP13_21925 [Sphingobacteriales bacterium 40-81]|nr:MAG: hypothetical protein BGP13_21925 [Sphingobacteriales bacterium 40-81]